MSETWQKNLAHVTDYAKKNPIFYPKENLNSSLDRYTVKSHHGKPLKRKKTFLKTWDKKQKRTYMKALSGVKKYLYQEKFIAHLTLTSSNEATNIRKHWDNLVKRVRRELDHQFQYIKVETNEGNGVIHAIIILHKHFNKYEYPTMHAYFSTLWNELHKSPNVWVSINNKKTNKSMRKLCGYIINQYVAGQNFIRMSKSLNWCFRGFLTKFKELLKEHGFKKTIKLWNFILVTKGLNNIDANIEPG